MDYIVVSFLRVILMSQIFVFVAVSFRDLQYNHIDI